VSATYRKPRAERTTDDENGALEAVENAMSSALAGAFHNIARCGLDADLVAEAIEHLYGWDVADEWREWGSA
jgi:hypothetical protein